MLTELKIITQEGCLYKAEVQEAGTHGSYRSVCVWSFLFGLTALCSGKTISSLSKIHMHTHMAFFALQLLQLSLKIQRNRVMDKDGVFKSNKILCSLCYITIEQCVPNQVSHCAFRFRCVYVRAQLHSPCVLCQQQTRCGWIPSLIFCSLFPMCFLILQFSIWKFTTGLLQHLRENTQH